MIIICNTIVDRRDHVQYLTVSKSYSDNHTCSLTEQNTTLKNLYYGLIQRTCNGFVLQMAHFYSKKSIVKKSLQNNTK